MLLQELQKMSARSSLDQMFAEIADEHAPSLMISSIAGSIHLLAKTKFLEKKSAIPVLGS